MRLIAILRGFLAHPCAFGWMPLVFLGCSSSDNGLSNLDVGDSTSATGGAGTTATGGSSTGGASTSLGGTSPVNATGGAMMLTGGSTSPSGGGNAAGGAVTGGQSNAGGATLGGSPTGGKSGTAITTGGAAVGGAPTGGRTSTALVTGGNAAGGGGSGGKAASGGTTATTGGTAAIGGKSGSGGTTSVATGATGGASTTGGTQSGGTSSTGTEFWISPTGKDTNPGTKESPMFSFCDTSAKVGACYKLCPSGSICQGGTIWAMDGTYKYSVTQKTGSSMASTASAPLNLFAESGASPVFDFTGMAVDSASRGLQIAGTYWHIRGLTVTKAGDTGIFVMGANITVERCVAHHNADAGIVIGVNSSQSGSGMNNLVLNCDSYQNNDTQTGGENADGFGMKENAGTGNVFRGCRAWDNADDGWDLYAWESPVTIDNCWAISQCKSTKGSNSDGNGFKLGGDSVSAKHILSNLYSVDNNYGSSGRGFTNNSNPASMSCTNCASWGNKAADQGVSGVSSSAPGSATAAKMIAAKRNADGSLPSISSL